MTSQGTHLYCGDPPMTLGQFFARDPDGGVPALFEGRDVFWSFNTRVAIRAACDLIGIEKGDEILAPAYNCGSEIDPLIHAGGDVRLYPVAKDLYVDPDEIEPLITARTRAVYVIHYFGVIQPRLAELRNLCDRYGLRLIEDCALSLLSGATPAEGATGDISVFCFHKFLPSVEGGALVINAPDLRVGDPFHSPSSGRVALKRLTRSAFANILGPGRAQRVMRRLRSQPAPHLPSDNHLADIPGHYYFDSKLQGRRISTFAERSLRAFSVSGMIASRRANWHHYHECLDGLPGVGFLKPELAPETCPLNMPVIVTDRDRIAQALQAQGIGATPWWAGFHCKLDWSAQHTAIGLKNNVLSLPLNPFLSSEHIDHIVSVLAELISSKN